jgi:hypothetical protein
MRREIDQNHNDMAEGVAISYLREKIHNAFHLRVALRGN